ncbi:MAG: type II secretion system F family protein [Anaerolineae bacterium]|nr:type II secretion system F family protein [Anaerolineae bacterium]
MNTNGPLLFGLLIALDVLVVFIALWRITRPKDPVEQRLESYRANGDIYAPQGGKFQPIGRQARRQRRGAGIGARLAEALSLADLPFTVPEYMLLILALATAGIILGILRLNLGFGAVLAAALATLPLIYLNVRRKRRQRAFSYQIPDMLTLLVGAMRAGYGLSQALEMLEERIPPPASKEIGRVIRATSLGIPVHQALRDMAARLDIDDLDLVVTAINVQHQMGGNLAQTLETIADTIRERIRIQREIRVLTSEQRFTGYVLGLLPIGVAFLIFTLNPGYMSRLFEPGLTRLVPIAAVLLQILGFFVISRIVDIEV